ncbi:ABC transporter ATP-binding protein [bacterium]|jgi:putative ABC transport system ATP-binding protein|nr:ABC transporter ATP-binding protein [bacterium]MBT4552688.1 ABC transporter ATP-binding protein [bacterium]MBT5988933.1 ABC transporter ATP-binding protein [bacterium]MBT7088348.1 ABC transporter ATP-binding protein [bacterium]
MIELNDICKNFYMGSVKLEVLKNLNLHIKKGELLAIQGASGVGKSTLMYIMGLLDIASSGTYILDKQVMNYVDDDNLSCTRNLKIGFVFQSFYLLPKLTALENVALPLVYRGLCKEEYIPIALEKLEKVRLAKWAYYKPNQLSGGQQQRVVIARALAGNPLVLLADEPTGALDQDTGKEIMQLFQRLNEEENITTVIIAHDEMIGKACKRKVLIIDGAIKEIT